MKSLLLQPFVCCFPWELIDGVIHLEYLDGTTQQVELADELYISSCAATFLRSGAW